ncbi:hypothetical protein HY792_07755, partial [Candidatus Desantisbacteria bacterium]|nr:hypothetical protein [Candidatus Desantisbacteria bacterium]
LGTITDDVYTAGMVGTWTITGKYNGLSGTATVVVTHGTATKLMIEPAWGTITSGATISYTATARDTASNTWSVTAGFSSNDTMGTFTNNVYTAGMVGTWTITGKYNGLSGTATVVVTHKAATVIRLYPSIIPVEINHGFDMMVMVDDVINLMGAEINIGFNPTKLEIVTVSQGELLGRPTGAAVVFFPATSTGKVRLTTSRMGGNPTGVTGSGTIATIHFKCISNDPSSLLYIDSTDLRNANFQPIPVTGTSGAMITATHGTATALVIDPAWGTITSGATLSCTAAAQDTAGNTWSVTAGFSSNDTLGTFTNNVYTAGMVGTWTITGKYNGLSDTATVVVTHNAATVIRLNSSVIPIAINHEFDINVMVDDVTDLIGAEINIG